MDWSFIGVCRDCKVRRNVPHSEVVNVEIPLCNNCRGVLAPLNGSYGSGCKLPSYHQGRNAK